MFIELEMLSTFKGGHVVQVLLMSSPQSTIIVFLVSQSRVSMLHHLIAHANGSTYF